MMNTHQILLALSVTNTALLAFLLTQPHRTAAQEVAPVVRGRAFEIVDDHGRVRAEIKVFPRDPAVKMPDGTTGYPETVLLRLIDSKGGPHVKLAATEDGSGISLGRQVKSDRYSDSCERRKYLVAVDQQGWKAAVT